MEQVLSRLAPDNLNPRPPRIIEGPGILIGIFNPTDTLSIEGESVCLGTLFGPREDWWRPDAKIPDGSYALFRGDSEALQLVSDIVASRTIWYSQTPNLFIAATSQRAIVSFLQSYEPNEAVYPWMLSSGTLGPALSWDRRIRCLGPDERLRLDRHTWEVRIEQTPVMFAPENLPWAEHERRLREALEATFGRLEVGPGSWVLPLSGGYDSRAILLLLKDRVGLRAVTWGLRSALEDRKSDAWVARELARHFGLAHEYYETDRSREVIETVLKRFLVAGEGRTDRISGYMDGFAIWRRLYESGCQGVLRGDEAFGWVSANGPGEVIHSIGMTRLADFRNLRHTGLPGMYPQAVPESLSRRDGESLQEWRDRLYQSFRLPLILAALNDVKSPYVEIVNPFLSRGVIAQVRQLPDPWRTDKRLIRRIVDELSPSIAIAERPAIEAPGAILRDPACMALIRNELEEGAARWIFPDELHAYLRSRATRSAEAKPVPHSSASHLKSMIKGLLPRRAASMARSTLARMRGKDSAEVDLDVNRLAFRAYLASRMHTLLLQDAAVLNRP
jgi:asparagine synthetase B (glutamine-hydrolysing)